VLLKTDALRGVYFFGKGLRNDLSSTIKNPMALINRIVNPRYCRSIFSNVLPTLGFAVGVTVIVGAGVGDALVDVGVRVGWGTVAVRVGVMVGVGLTLMSNFCPSKIASEESEFNSLILSTVTPYQVAMAKRD